MYISELINQHGSNHRPYMRGLVNHLPMAQLALFKLSESPERVKEYTEAYVERAKIDPINEEYPKIDSIEECVGNRELYEACLVLIEKELEEKDPKEFTSYLLNTYSLGMSSGLFHTIIRVAYAIEGYEMNKELKEELARALAYYITAYREGKLLTRKVNYVDLQNQMDRLINLPHLKEIRQSNQSLGQKLNTFYNDEEYLREGFLIKGSEEEKIQSLLGILLQMYLNTLDIVILHCITGLHALIVLRDYFEDFENALDIFTSFAITHALTLKDLGVGNGRKRLVDFSWANLISMGIESPDVHTLKFTYSCSELSKRYDMVDLKRAARWKITHLQ